MVHKSGLSKLFLKTTIDKGAVLNFLSVITDCNSHIKQAMNNKKIQDQQDAKKTEEERKIDGNKNKQQPMNQNIENACYIDSLASQVLSIENPGSNSEITVGKFLNDIRYISRMQAMLNSVRDIPDGNEKYFVYFEFKCITIETENAITDMEFEIKDLVMNMEINSINNFCCIKMKYTNLQHQIKITKSDASDELQTSVTKTSNKNECLFAKYNTAAIKGSKCVLLFRLQPSETETNLQCNYLLMISTANIAKSRMPKLPSKLEYKKLSLMQKDTLNKFFTSYGITIKQDRITTSSLEETYKGIDETTKQPLNELEISNHKGALSGKSGVDNSKNTVSGKPAFHGYSAQPLDCSALQGLTISALQPKPPAHELKIEQQENHTTTLKEKSTGFFASIKNFINYSFCRIFLNVAPGTTDATLNQKTDDVSGKPDVDGSENKQIIDFKDSMAKSDIDIADAAVSVKSAVDGVKNYSAQQINHFTLQSATIAALQPKPQIATQK